MAETKAVLLDALGTLVELKPPAPPLRAAIERLSGVDVGREAAERGFAAEIGHYLANHMRAGDDEALALLRDECAEAMRAAIGRAELDVATVRAAMLEALEFEAFDDVLPALGDLRARGLRLVVVSNWDCSLPTWLERAGLGGLLDGAVSSAVVGAAKPAPAVFEAGLALAGCAADEAVLVGDSVENDVEGARAVGIRAILIQRDGDLPAGVEAVRSLRDLSAIV
jgi:putative hydrolase of the HAD superfamily